MVTVRGKTEVTRYINGLPGQINKVLQGAARAAAKVVADEAKSRSLSQEVSDGIGTRTKVEGGRIVCWVSVKKGWASSVGTWLEYGTSAHFISVDERQRMGMSVGRINKQVKAGSLVINGNFVGSTVRHPGARPHPFLRPALDTKQGEALAAAQGYINSHVTGGQVVATAEADEG
jgi:hypothetical protein